MTRANGDARSHGGGGAGALLILDAAAAAAGGNDGGGKSVAPGAAPAPPATTTAAPATTAAAAKQRPPSLKRGMSLFFEIVTGIDEAAVEERIRRASLQDSGAPAAAASQGCPAPPARAAAAALPPRPPPRTASGGMLSTLGERESPTAAAPGVRRTPSRSVLFALPPQPPLQQQQQRPSTLAAAAAAAPSLPSARPPTMTPAEVLHELLGDLFIDPARLTEHELLGEGGFAAVHAATLAPPGGGGDAASSAFAAATPPAAAASGPAAPSGPTAASSLPFGEPVAVKRLRPDALPGPEELKEFLAEANLLRKMHHPHVVALRGVGSRDLSDFVTMRRSMYVVQERMDAGDLRALVQAQAAHPFRRVYARADALRWARQVAAAVDYLHSVCRPMVIHRDLKLDNVLLATPDRGLAASAGGAGGGAAAAAQGVAAATAAAEAARSGEPATGEWTAKLADFGLHKRLRRRVSVGGGQWHQQQEEGAVAAAGRQDGTGNGNGTGGGGGGGEEEWVAWDSAGPSYRGADYEPSYYGANNFYSAISGQQQQQRQQQALAASAGRRSAAERALVREGGGSGGGGSSGSGRSILETVARDASVRRRAEAVRAIEDGSVHGGGANANANGSGHGSRHGSGHGRLLAAAAICEIAPVAEAFSPAPVSPPPPGAAAWAAARAGNRNADGSYSGGADGGGGGGGGSGRGGGAAPVEATTRVGSLLYMAPEVLRGEPYNEKVDVFSFGVMLYELFSGRPLGSRVAAAAAAGDAGSSSGGSAAAAAKPPAPALVVVAGGAGADPEADAEQGTLLAYAQRVAGGHREPMPEAWPAGLKALVAACWHADPRQRPSFGSLVRALDLLEGQGAAEAMDAAQAGLRTDYDPLNDCGCGCAIM